jgi:hypothetical protein
VKIADPDGVVTPALRGALRVEIGDVDVATGGEADITLHKELKDGVRIDSCGGTVHVDLSDALPIHRTRLLALAISEVHRRPCAIAPPTGPGGIAIDPPAMHSDRKAPKIDDARPPPTVWIAMLARFSLPMVLAEPRAGFSIGAGPSWLRARFDAGYLFSQNGDAFGTVDLHGFTASAGLGARIGQRALSLEIGPRFEIGAIFLRPTPRMGFASRNVDAPLVSGSIDAMLRIVPIRGVIIMVLARIASTYGVEARANDRRIGGIDGFDVSLGAGAAVDLPH